MQDFIKQITQWLNSIHGPLTEGLNNFLGGTAFGNAIQGAANSTNNILSSLGGFNNSGSGFLNSLAGLDWSSLFNSVIAYYTRNDLTGAEQQQNAWNAEQAQINRDYQTNMSNTAFQRQVSDMQAAGLNPALMYGQGSNGASTPSGNLAQGTANAGGDLIGSMIQMMLLKSQIGLQNAQIEKTKAETKLTEQKALTEEQETKIRKIAADYGVELTQTQILEIWERIENLDADTDLKMATEDKIKAETAAQEIKNKFLNERERAEIDEIKAHKNNMDADTKLKQAQTWFQNIQAKYANDNGFLMSANDTLQVAMFLADLFGISHDDIKYILGTPLRKVRRRINHDKSSSGGGSR